MRHCYARTLLATSSCRSCSIFQIYSPGVDITYAIFPEQWHPHIHLHIPWNYCPLPRPSVTDSAPSQNLFGSQISCEEVKLIGTCTQSDICMQALHRILIHCCSFSFCQQIYLDFGKTRNCLVNLLTFPGHSTLESSFKGCPRSTLHYRELSSFSAVSYWYWLRYQMLIQAKSAPATSFSPTFLAKPLWRILAKTNTENSSIHSDLLQKYSKLTTYPRNGMVPVGTLFLQDLKS